MWKDAKIIYDKVNSIPPVSEIPDGLTKDLYPYYLDKPYLNEYGNTGDGGNTSHDYVEIGGIKWATMNLGAESVTDYGKYYAWGEIDGYTADQVGYDKSFTWSDYELCDGTSSNMTKYNSTDGKTELDSEDDAVTQEWGRNWRTPTIEEWEALGNSVNFDYTSDYQGSGVAGIIFTDREDSSKTLFFPYAGYGNNGSIIGTGSNLMVWSSSVNDSNVTYSYRLGNDDGITFSDYSTRFLGFTVRGVLDK